MQVGTVNHRAGVRVSGGIRATSDRLRISRDGMLVATNLDAVASIRAAGGPVKILANHADDRPGKPALVGDEPLVWARPKTP